MQINALGNWSRAYTALYLQQQYKRQHDRTQGGGTQPVPVKVKIAGALGKVSGRIVGTA